MIKILFFDFDGTISDAKNLALKSLLKTLDTYGYHFGTNRIKKLLGIKIPNILKILGIEAHEMNKIRRDFYAMSIRGVYSLKLCTSIRPLWALKKKYKIIVVSNSESSFVKESAKKLGAGKLFNEIHGAEGFSSKDKLLRKLFNKFKIKPREAIYIGDRFSDIKYARVVGCYSVSIHNKCSWSTLKEIKAESPDFIIKNFTELKGVIKKIDSTENKH